MYLCENFYNVSHEASVVTRNSKNEVPQLPQGTHVCKQKHIPLKSITENA